MLSTERTPAEAPGATWSGTHTFAAPVLLRPRSAVEVQELVAQLPKVRALGTRHSFNDVADSAGALISLVDLPADPSIDDKRSTVTVAAGTRFGNLAKYLEANSLALHNLGSLPHISIAGACATGTHGSGDSNGSLSTAVAGLEIVTASGEIKNFRRGDPDFGGMVLSLGALGIVTRIELDVQPTYEVRQDAYTDLPWSRVLEDPDAVFATGYSVSLLTDWLGDFITETLVKTRLDGDRPFERAAVVADLTEVGSFSGVGNRTPLGGVAGPWNQRLPHFLMESTPSDGDEIQTEYFVDRDRAAEALSAVRALAPRIAPLLHISELRTVAADDLWLSPNRGAGSLAIHFTWKNLPEQVAAILSVIEKALAPVEPRPHWGKWFHMDSDRVSSMYPRLSHFVSLSNRLDPHRKFRNSYLERVLALPNDQTSPSATNPTRKALRRGRQGA